MLLGSSKTLNPSYCCDLPDQGGCDSVLVSSGQSSVSCEAPSFDSCTSLDSRVVPCQKYNPTSVTEEAVRRHSILPGAVVIPASGTMQMEAQ